MFVPIVGTVAVSSRDGLGHVVPIVEEGPGQFLAEIGQLSGRPALVDARAKIDIDISGVNLPQPPLDERPSSRAPKSVLALMLVVIVAMALIALYANVQRWRRAEIETVTITPASSPSISPSPSTPPQ